MLGECLQLIYITFFYFHFLGWGLGHVDMEEMRMGAGWGCKGPFMCWVEDVVNGAAGAGFGRS